MFRTIFRNFHNSQKGQTLVVIVFLMVAALAIGVSVSNRFINTLSITSSSYTHYQATAVAEAAIERILTLTTAELEDFILHGTCGSYCNLEIIGPDGVVQTATVTLNQLGQGSEPFQIRVTTTEVTEINLEGYGNNRPLSICWDPPQSGSSPSIYATLIYGFSERYMTDTHAYNSVGVIQPNGFSQATAANGFQNCMTVNSQTAGRVLRLRSFYNDVDVMVFPDAGATLPPQGILIESTGRVLNSTSKVSVIKSSNVVPIDFDYVIFQRSESEPLSN